MTFHKANYNVTTKHTSGYGDLVNDLLKSQVWQMLGQWGPSIWRKWSSASFTKIISFSPTNAFFLEPAWEAKI